MKLNTFIEEILSDLESLGVSQSTALLLLIGAGVLFVLICYRLVVGRRRGESSPQMVRAASSIQDLTLRVNDFIGKVSQEQTWQEEQIKTIQGRLWALEKRLGVEQSVPPAAPQLMPEFVVTTPETPKKKPELVVATPERATLSAGLQKTRSGFLTRIAELFGRKRSLDTATIESLEELLITADLGVKTTGMLLERLTRDSQDELEVSDAEVFESLKGTVRSILRSDGAAEIVPKKRGELPLVLLVVGVNGVGKTTTIGKLARRFVDQGARVMLAACDTFRAAAAQQIGVWAERSGVLIEAADEEGAKPSTVAYRAIHRAREAGVDVLIIDTAGRLHTRANLMSELGNLVRIISREQEGAPHETLLVLDASTGQNALQQAREFHELVNLTGLVVTKLDGTPKGGIVVAIKNELGIPIRYIGVGEGVYDLQPFDSEAFVEALFERGAASSAAEPVRRVVRRG